MSATKTIAAGQLAHGDTVKSPECGVGNRTHTVAEVSDSFWPDRSVLEFTDGCQMYAVPHEHQFIVPDPS